MLFYLCAKTPDFLVSLFEVGILNRQCRKNRQANKWVLGELLDVWRFFYSYILSFFS